MFFAALFFADFSYAEGLASKEAINYYNEGVEQQAMGNFVDALTAYQKTIILAPHDLTYKKFILNNTGVMHVTQGDLEGAEEAFLKALDMDPDYLPANLNLSLIYYTKGDRLRSIEYFLKAHNLNFDEARPTKFTLEDKCATTEY